MVEGQEQAEVNQDVEANAEQQEQTNEVDVKAMMARLEKLESTNERLLNESKQYKSKYQGLRNEVETKQKSVLEEQENWKELLEIEKNRAFELENSMKDLKKRTLEANLRGEVATYAKDAYSVHDVINNLPKDILEIDDENLRVNGIKDAVEAVRKEKSYLFNTGVKNHGMSQEPPAEYKQETKEPSLEEILGAGLKQGVI